LHAFPAVDSTPNVERAGVSVFPQAEGLAEIAALAANLNAPGAMNVAAIAA
jgi:hypothetical protein